MKHGSAPDDRRYERDDRRPRRRDDDRVHSPSVRRRSPSGHRDRNPVREGSAERRAKIEQWNRERDGRHQSDDGNENGH